MTRLFACALLASVACLLVADAARAHPLAFGVLSVTAQSGDRYTLDFRYSGDENDPRGGSPTIPRGCDFVAPPDELPLTSGIHLRGRLRCPRGIEGLRFGVEGLERGETQVVVRVRLPDGREHRGLVTADEPSFRIPRRNEEGSVLARYVVLGTEHIALGLDHLLFVLGLFLLVDGWKRVVATVTAFTLGHSLTLALAALGVVHVPSAPTEACIALSIVLLAVELAHPDRQSTARTRPWLVASSFGLLHGLGFAGALAEVGLPRAAVVPALFGFNLGVELGQIAFVAVLALLSVATRRTLGSQRTDFVRAAILPRALGAVAVFFLAERIAAIVA